MRRQIPPRRPDAAGSAGRRRLGYFDFSVIHLKYM